MKTELGPAPSHPEDHGCSPLVFRAPEKSQLHPLSKWCFLQAEGVAEIAMLRFRIQGHQAWTHRADYRLEWGGELQSWALPEKANLDRTCISDTERATRNPGVKNVAHLAKALCIIPARLMEVVSV